MSEISHPLQVPQLVDAYFSVDATTVVMNFDDQPTNEAGFTGRVACTSMLDASTSSVLRGTGASSTEVWRLAT